jgi:zinc protease
MINRQQAPAFNEISQIPILQAKKDVLDNGIEVYSIDSGSQELVRIELCFNAGAYFQSRKLQASHAGYMMENGTKNFSAEEISENLDYYGSYYETSVGFDDAYLALYSLNKHLNDSIVYLEEIVKNASFPKEEYDIFLQNAKQKFKVNLKKVSAISKNEFAALIFGDKHPYNNKVRLEDFDSIEREHLVDFYKSHYQSGNCTIIISGKLPSNYLSLLNNHFGKQSWGDSNKIKSNESLIYSSNQNKNLIIKEDAIQSSVRVGRNLFSKLHPDYFKFQVLNTVLGGYFGSRLMSNIREDKGYTYGIGSGLISMQHGGYFSISTEVGVDVTKNTLHEIYFEIKRLREDLIPDDELQIVKNYLLGVFLRSADGPFALSAKFKSIWQYGLNYDYYQNYIQAVKGCTAIELRDLANKYLREEDLIELVVGKM